MKPVTETYPITKEILAKLQRLLNPPHTLEGANAHEEDPMGTDVKPIFPAFSNLSMVPTGVVKGGQVALHADGSTSGISLSHGSRNNVHVRLWNHDTNNLSEVNFEFTKLPSSIAVKYISASLLPQDREETIRMVINQSRRPWSDLTEKGKSGPVLVERRKKSFVYSYRQHAGVPCSLTGRPEAERSELEGQ